MSEPRSFNVLIVGGGTAALEAAFRLQRVAENRIRTTILAALARSSTVHRPVYSQRFGASIPPSIFRHWLTSQPTLPSPLLFASECAPAWPRLLFTRAGNWNDEFAVFLSDEVLALAARTSIAVLLLDRNDELLRWRQRQANLASTGRILRGRSIFRVFRRKVDEFDLRNFVAGPARLHHFVKAENHRIGALRIKERFERGGVFGFEGGFVFVEERLLLFGGTGVKRETRCDCEREN